MPLQPITGTLEHPVKLLLLLGVLQGHWEKPRQVWEPPRRKPRSAEASADRRVAQCPLLSRRTSARSPQAPLQPVWSKQPIPRRTVPPDPRHPTADPTPKHGTGRTKELNRNQSSAAQCSPSSAAIAPHGTAVPASPLLAEGLSGTCSPPRHHRGHRSSPRCCGTQGCAEPTTI